MIGDLPATLRLFLADEKIPLSEWIGQAFIDFNPLCLGQVLGELSEPLVKPDPAVTRRNRITIQLERQRAPEKYKGHVSHPG